MPRLLPPALAAGLAAALFAPGRPCDAQELVSDAARVQQGWAGASTHVTRLSPRFLQAGQTLPLRLPSGVLESEGFACTSVAILGARTTTFTATLAAERVSTRMPASSSSLRSSSGALALSRCGPARQELSHLSVRLNAGRGALEFIVAQGPGQPPAPDTFLPERQPGLSASLADVGFTPDVEPAPARLAEAERRMRGTGARLAQRRTLQAPLQGTATLDLSFDPGCHRIMLLPDTGPGRPVDVDAELLDLQDRPLVRDRSNATDAVLDLCVGETTPAQLAWIASNRNARVTLLHATWPIPQGFPYEWGAHARAALAASHRKRHTPPLSALPVWEGVGLPGRTSIPVRVDPEACYVAGVAPTRGEARALTLSVSAGPAHHHDTSGGGYESAMLSFCASGARVVTLEVDGSGRELHWVAALWRTGRMPLGSAEPW